MKSATTKTNFETTDKKFLLVIFLFLFLSTIAYRQIKLSEFYDSMISGISKSEYATANIEEDGDTDSV